MPPERIEIRVASELRPLLPRFLENRHADVLKLEAALRQRDQIELRQIGHILKGAGSSYGFVDISRIGGEIEVGARNGEFDRLGEHIAALKEYLEAVDIVFV